MIEAVIFDLDGVLIDSEQVWASAREQLVRERGGSWHEEATREMMGMSSPEWSRYMHEALGVPMEPEEITAEVVRRLEDSYRAQLPLIAGAREAVAALARRWQLGLASSANRSVLELVLELSGLRDYFATTVSAEEVARGKPAPDVYLAAACGLRVSPAQCAAVEDSANGLRAAVAAGLWTVVTPTFWTQGSDFSAAGLVLPHLGDPSRPLPAEPGTALKTQAWLEMDELQELARPVRPLNPLRALYEGRRA